MTHEEAAQVVQVLAAAWRIEIPALSAAVWLDHLRAVNVDVGHETCRLVIANGGAFMPSPGEFLETAQQVARRLASQQQALPEEATSHVQRPRREEALERVRALREVVARAEVRLPSWGSPTSPSDRPERRVPLTPCALDDHRFCGSTSAARPKEPSADDASPPQP